MPLLLPAFIIVAVSYSALILLWAVRLRSANVSTAGTLTGLTCVSNNHRLSGEVGVRGCCCRSVRKTQAPHSAGRKQCDVGHPLFSSLLKAHQHQSYHCYQARLIWIHHQCCWHTAGTPVWQHYVQSQSGTALPHSRDLNEIKWNEKKWTRLTVTLTPHHCPSR